MQLTMRHYILALLIQVSLCMAENMNNGGVPYAISNTPGSTPNWKGTPGKYTTDFATSVEGEVEYFDVYGEVQTVYSQVYWTRNAPINLPPEIVARFEGKVMAITGYEVDQVVHSGPQVGSTSSQNALGGFSCYPECEGNDTSIPIYNAYNHHYFSWLKGSDSEIYELESPLKMPNPTTTAFRTKEGTEHGFPTSLVFKENPGGEFRKSYHGYPSGYAQLIHSPSQWLVEPMQIDTHNRNYEVTDQVGHKPWFMPTRVQNNMTNLHNGLSPLIECPCTDRIERTVVNSSSILIEGTCSRQILSEKDCVSAITETGAKVKSSSTINDLTIASGCIMRPAESSRHHSNAGQALEYDAIFNAAKSTQSCGKNNEKVSLQGSNELGTGITISISHDTSEASITVSGPASVWFGIGFGATSMKDEPYAIIIDGNGEVTERKLDNHGPGNALSNSITIVSSSVHGEIRTLVLRRSVNGSSTDHYTFPTVPGDINMIAAIGDGKTLSYHKSRSGGTLTLIPTETPSCICYPTTAIYFSYMNSTKMQVNNYDCLDEPRSDMLRHGDGTGRDLPNMACNFETYNGGLECCKHSWLLTDKNQDEQVPKDKVDTYFLKWRYYFQEYAPATEKLNASHQHLHHWVFLIDATVNDYEEDNARYGTTSIGTISAHLKAKDIGLEDLEGGFNDDGAPPIPKNFTKIKPMVMTPHCHAPSCIRQELWNADTNEIICNMTAKYGDEKYGKTTEIFNERDYITILPCLYGYQPGLQFPFSLSPDTNIRAIKYFNNTYRHLGQMAQWTGLMVYDVDPY